MRVGRRRDGPAGARRGWRSNSARSATSPSMRASCAPRQKCAPLENARWSLAFALPTSKEPGSVKTRGSRLAAARTVTTRSPAATGLPATSVSTFARRAVRSTGGSKRSISSIAIGHSSGSAARRSRCSGWANSWLVPLPMRLTVVSKPAASTSSAVETSSCSERPAPSSSTRPTRLDRRSSPGSRRSRRRCSRIQSLRAARFCSIAACALRVSPMSSEVAAPSPHARNWSRIEVGTPSISLITVTGSRLA